MHTAIIISVSLITLTSCGSSRKICDAYAEANDIVVDTMWALPSTEVVCPTLNTENNNNQPQPETPESTNDFAYIREDKETTGSIREA